MWIVRLALRRPYTFVVLALAIILLTPVVLLRTPTDIFPEINIPVVSIAWTYPGISQLEMERRVTSTIERGATTMVNDIEHLESQSLPGITIIKLYFHPKANISTALAQTAAATETMMKWLPPGATPPLVIIYSASTVPVIQIGLTSDTMSEQQLFDTGTTFLRPKLTTVNFGRRKVVDRKSTRLNSSHVEISYAVFCLKKKKKNKNKYPYQTHIISFTWTVYTR